MEAWCPSTLFELDRNCTRLCLGVHAGAWAQTPQGIAPKSATSARTGRNKAIMSHLTPRTLAVVGAEDEARRLEEADARPHPRERKEAARD